MPTAARRVCSVYGCQEQAPCVRHRTQQDTRIRGSRHDRGYDSRWTRTTNAWKARHPLCGMRQDMRLHPEHSECTRKGIPNAGTKGNELATDHIIPREQGGPDEPANYQTLCKRCHSVKTAGERDERRHTPHGGGM